MAGEHSLTPDAAEVAIVIHSAAKCSEVECANVLKFLMQKEDCTF